MVSIITHSISILKRSALNASRCVSTRRAMGRHDRQCLRAIPRSLDEARSEVFQSCRVDPRVVLRKRRQPFVHQRWGEQFGQRAGHCLDPPVGLAERHIRFSGQAHSGEHMALVLHLLARDAERFAELDPALDAAGARFEAVVVDDPLNPLPAHIGVGAVGQDRAILSRDRALVGEAVGDPSLELALGRGLPLASTGGTDGSRNRSYGTREARQRARAQRAAGPAWGWGRRRSRQGGRSGDARCHGTLEGRYAI